MAQETDHKQLVDNIGQALCLWVDAWCNTNPSAFNVAKIALVGEQGDNVVITLDHRNWDNPLRADNLERVAKYAQERGFALEKEPLYKKFNSQSKLLSGVTTTQPLCDKPEEMRYGDRYTFTIPATAKSLETLVSICQKLGTPDSSVAAGKIAAGRVKTSLPETSSAMAID